MRSFTISMLNLTFDLASLHNLRRRGNQRPTLRDLPRPLQIVHYSANTASLFRCFLGLKWGNRKHLASTHR